MARKNQKPTTSTPSDAEVIDQIQSKASIALTKANKTIETTLTKTAATILADLTTNVEKLEETKTEALREENARTLARQQHADEMKTMLEDAELEKKDILDKANEEATDMLADAKSKTTAEINSRNTELKQLDDELAVKTLQTSRIFKESVASDKAAALATLLDETNQVAMSADEKAEYEGLEDKLRKEFTSSQKAAISAVENNMKHAHKVEIMGIESSYKEQLVAVQPKLDAKDAEITRLEATIAGLERAQDQAVEIKKLEAQHTNQTFNLGDSNNKR